MGYGKLDFSQLGTFGPLHWKRASIHYLLGADSFYLPSYSDYELSLSFCAALPSIKFASITRVSKTPLSSQTFQLTLATIAQLIYWLLHPSTT